MDWETKWLAEQTPWDTGVPAPALCDWLQATRRKPQRVLVPGAGGGHDAFALAKAGWQVTALDISPTAVEQLLAQARKMELDNLQAHAGDFLDPGFITTLGEFEAIWDYTFLCALPLASRPVWAEHMTQLLAADGELLTLIFPIKAVGGRRDDEGPPYRLTPQDVQALLAPLGFAAAELRPVARSLPSRAGLEWFGRWSRNSP